MRQRFLRLNMCIIRYFDKNYKRIFPDFYKPGEWVLDAKYKKITDGKISREDLFQLVTYMHVMKIPRAVLFFHGTKKKTVRTKTKPLSLKVSAEQYTLSAWRFL